MARTDGKKTNMRDIDSCRTNFLCSQFFCHPALDAASSLHALFWIPRSSRGMTNNRTFITPASIIGVTGRKRGASRDKHVARGLPQTVLGIAADIKGAVGMHADPPHNKKRRPYLLHVFQYLLVRLAHKEGCFHFHYEAVISRDIPRHIKVFPVYLREAVVYYFAVKHLLFLESEESARPLGKHARDILEGRVMEVRVVRGHRL